MRGRREGSEHEESGRKRKTGETRQVGARGWKDENAFAYEIKWRIYTVRSQYTYVRPTVNYTVNRGVLFDRRGKEDRARGPTRTKDESWPVREGKGGGKREGATTAKFMEREMIYGTIVENKSHGSKDV